MEFQAPRERESIVEGPQFSGDVSADDTRAWEQVDTGRYMPRRIKGSYKGRALG